MKGLAALLLSLFDLFEAEGRLLQENIIVTVQRCVILALGLIFGAAALAFLAAAAYALLAIYTPAPVACLLMALLCLCICGVMLWWVKQKKTLPKKKNQHQKTSA